MDRRRSRCRPAPPMLRPAAARPRRARWPRRRRPRWAGRDARHGRRRPPAPPRRGWPAPTGRRPRHRAPAGGPRRRWPCRARVHQRHRLGPAVAAAAAISGRSAVFGLSLAHRGRRQRRWPPPPPRSRRPSGRTCGGDPRGSGSSVHLHRHDRRRCRGQHLGRRGELVDGAAPDRGHHRAPVRTSGGSSSASQSRCRGPAVPRSSASPWPSGAGEAAGCRPRRRGRAT